MQSTDLTDARSPAYTPGVPRPANLKALTSIRFFAAMHVALYHLVRPFTRWGIFTGFFENGYIGVSFFFLISGFILTYSHAAEYESGRGNAKKFWVARFARIYPVYAVSILYAGYVYRAEFAAKIHAIAFVAELLLMQSWNVHLVAFFSIPAWTISVEAFFYFVFPFVLLRLRPSSAGKAIAAVVFFWLLAVAVPLFCVLHWPQLAWHEDASHAGPGSLFIFNVRRLPILMLPQFLAGISLGWFYLRFRPNRRTASFLATFGAAATLAALMLANHFPFVMLHNGLFLPLFAVLLLGLSGDNWLSRLLSPKWLVLLGEASFSIYLFHFIFNDQHWFGANVTFRSAALTLAVILPLSVLLHLYVERPCRRAILAWWRTRHPQELALVPPRTTA